MTQNNLTNKDQGAKVIQFPGEYKEQTSTFLSDVAANHPKAVKTLAVIAAGAVAGLAFNTISSSNEAHNELAVENLLGEHEMSATMIVIEKGANLRSAPQIGSREDGDPTKAGQTKGELLVRCPIIAKDGWAAFVKPDTNIDMSEATSIQEVASNMYWVNYDELKGQGMAREEVLAPGACETGVFSIDPDGVLHSSSGEPVSYDQYAVSFYSTGGQEDVEFADRGIVR